MFRIEILFFLLITFLVTPAYAEAEKAASPWSATFTAVSDYIDRGVSENDNHPALQASFDYALESGFYAGLWASPVDFNDGDQAWMELDLYTGYSFPVDDVTLDVGLAAYIYPGANQGTNHYNYLEVKASAARTFGPADMKAELNYSPEYSADSGRAVYINVSGEVPFGDSGFRAIGSTGHQWIARNAAYGLPDYTDWSAGIGYNGWNDVDFVLKYTDNDIGKADCADICDARAVFSVEKTF